MFDGYFAFGHTELVNAGRVRAYVKNLLPSIPAGVGMDALYETIAESLGDTPYVDPVTDGAPWVSPDDPNTNDFYGVFPQAFEGIATSTLAASVTERIDAGGVVNDPRDTSRSIRVRALVVGATEIAVEAGKTWLRNALARKGCTMHDDGCELSDATFFLARPDADSPDETIRYYHSVECTRGLETIRELETDCGAVQIVEFILTAQNPFMYGEPHTVAGALTPGLTYLSDVLYNFASNADASQTSGLVEYASNYCTNPSGETNTTGWTSIPGTTGVAALTNPTTATAYGTKVIRNTWSTASTAVGGGLYFDCFGIVAGRKYSFAINHVLTSIINRIQLQVEWRTAGATISTVTTAPVNVTVAGTIYDATNYTLLGLVAPAGAVVARVKVITVAGTSSANWSIGSYIQVDGVMVNQGEIISPYFDLSTPLAADDYGIYVVGNVIQRVRHQIFAWIAQIANGADPATLMAFGTGSAATWYQTSQQGVVGNTVSAARVQWWQAPTDDADVYVGGSFAYPVQNSTLAGIQEFITYTVSLYVRSSKNQRIKLRSKVFSNLGVELSSADSAGVAVLANTWTRLNMQVSAPAGSNDGFIDVFAMSTNGAGYSRWAAGDYIDTDGMLITVGTTLYDWFYGDSPDTPQWAYGYFGPGDLYGTSYAEGAGPSFRRPYDPAVDGIPVLVDPDLPALPTPPAPPVVPSQAIVTQYDWTRYYITIDNSEVPLWAGAVPIVTLTTDTEDVRQVRVRFYPNPDELAIGDINVDAFDYEFVLSYLPADGVVTIDGVEQEATAVIGGLGPIPADQLLYGTEGGPMVWGELSGGVNYFLTVDIIPTANIANLEVGLELVRRE